MIHLSKDHRYYKQTKHIDVRYHKIRQWVVDNKVIDFVKISRYDDEDHPGGEV